MCRWMQNASAKIKNIAKKQRKEQLNMNGINLIAVDRTRQIENKGSEVRGDLVRYGNDELIRAAVVYAMPFDIREA